MRHDSDIDHIFFTADLHFFHDKIINICERPIDIDSHNQWLIDKINNKIGKHDTLYILGDVSMSNKINTERILNMIKCKNIFLIAGNHDSNILNSNRFKQISQIKNFTFNSPSYPNLHIVLCHYPIASWERRVHNSWHLYGHTHGRFQNEGLSFDVGIDANNFEILSLRDVINKMELRKLLLYT